MVKKRFNIKIPSNVSIFYCTTTKLLLILGPYGRKSIKLKTKIFLYNEKNYIQLTKIPVFTMSKNKKKN